MEWNSVGVRKEKLSPTPAAFARLNNVVQPRAVESVSKLTWATMWPLAIKLSPFFHSIEL
jgi:hypothetical protein